MGFQQVTREQAAAASVAFGGVVNLVSEEEPSWAFYTYGKVGDATVRIYFAADEVVGIPPTWWLVGNLD